MSTSKNDFNFQEEVLKLREEVKNLKQGKAIKKEFLTRSETSHFLGVSLSTLHDWVNLGLLKPYKLGKRTFFKHSEIVETLLKSNS